MSIVKTYKVTDLSNNVIIPEGGSVVDVQYYRYDLRTTFTYGWNQQSKSTNTHPLKLRLDNVDNANNIIVCEWMLSGEEDNTSGFGVKIARNGSIITSDFGTGSAESYPLYFQAYANFGFDGDNHSTPHSVRILYIGKAGTTGVVEYSLWCNDGGQSSGTYYVNRCVDNAGANEYENGVCTGIIYEIASPGGY